MRPPAGSSTAPGPWPDAGVTASSGGYLTMGTRPQLRTYGCPQPSTVDEVVFGRDLDGSTTTIPLADRPAYAGAHGRRPVPHYPHIRRLDDAGLARNLADVDEVVFGRDTDGSNNAVKDVRQAKAFAGASGATTRA